MAKQKITTAEEALAAVKQDADALEYVPEKLKTAELCLIAVKQDGYALEFVPEKFKTPELCLEAVRQSGYALKYVPDNLKTAEMCNKALKKGVGAAFRYLPENLKTAELCLEAVKQDGYVLEYVPENLKTTELCLEAVKQKCRALKYVPENLKTAELCHEAVNYYNGRIHHGQTADDRRGSRGQYFINLGSEIESVFKEMPEELREEMRINLKNESGWLPDSMRQYAAEINIGALTQEAISFEFNELSERKSDFVTDKIKVFITIPDHREVPKSIILKLTNIGKTAEQRETVINCNGRFTKAELEGIVILHTEGIAGKSSARNGYRYRQKAEITLNFENRCETLTCPISRTTTFGMCFYDAYEAQTGKPDSVGSICEFPEQ